MKVSVERYVRQVRDGTHYNGDVKIGGVTFDYELLFVVPIPELEQVTPPQDASGIRSLFQLTVRKSGADIELTDKEYGFFFSMLVEFAVDFYHNPQTRDSQEGFLGMTLRGEEPMSDFADASVGLRSNGSFNLPPELCEMLSAPKFGCSLTS